MASPESVIDATVKYINRLIRHYGIEPHDWPIMQRESPGLWQAIEAIEWGSPLSLDETHRNCRRLLLNYERMFMRRGSGSLRHAA